jgi:hypothetical protein
VREDGSTGKVALVRLPEDSWRAKVSTSPVVPLTVGQLAPYRGQLTLPRVPDVEP